MLNKVYGYWLLLLTTLFGIDFAKQFDTYLRFRRNLNLKNPQTLADKVTYLFLHKTTPLMSQCTDKWAVREYIAKKGMAEILIPTVGGPYSKVEDIDFNALPDKFILKATHGCAMNLLVWDKTQLDIQACKKRLQSWLNTTYGAYSVEPHYKTIPHRIYAEQVLGDKTGLIDYKFHCCNGKTQFIMVCHDRDLYKSGHQMIRELFDTDWKDLSQYVIPATKATTPRPTKLAQMLEIATILSSDFPFVRVDLYEVNGKIYFGELTFSPAAGIFPKFTINFVSKMGKKLTITESQNG